MQHDFHSQPFYENHALAVLSVEAGEPSVLPSLRFKNRFEGILETWNVVGGQEPAFHVNSRE